MMTVEIPLRSAKINGDAQMIALPVEDVMAAMARKAGELEEDELIVLAAKCAKEILCAKDTNRG